MSSKHHKHPGHHQRTKRHPSFVHAVIGSVSIISILILILLSGSATHRPFRSTEVMFSDGTEHGLEIIPASGASEALYTGTYTGTYQVCTVAPGTTPDNGGFVLTSGITNKWVNRHSYSFCVTNSGGLNYFIPANTPTELQSFYNAIPRLNGVTQTPP